MDPSDAMWWWKYGLDGVIGAVLGGLVAGVVAGLVVRRTIKHERRLARDVRVMELVARLRGATLRVMVPMAAKDMYGRELLPEITDMQATAFELTGLTARDWPAFGKRIEDLMVPVSEAIAHDLTMETAGMMSVAIWEELEALSRVCGEFLRDPESV